MLVNCPICSEILLPSDVLFSTPCGHIFHMFCLNRWISSNSTCPQCRQECSQNNIHRIYLPEVNFQDQDALIERMNDINRQKIEYESKLKKIEQEKKSLESDLKKKKKEFHKIVQRSKNIKKGSSNIPPRHLKNATVNIFMCPRSSQASTSKHHSSSSTVTSSSVDHPKKKRNSSRVQRAKRYFQRKRDELRNNNNSTNESEADALEIQADNNVVDVESSADSIVAISVSTDSNSSN